MEILLPRMKYTHEIVGTHGGALLPGVCPWSMLREQNPSRVSTFTTNQRKIKSIESKKLLLISSKESKGTCSNFQSLFFDIFLFVRVQVLPESMYD